MPQEYVQHEGYRVHTKWNDMTFGGSALIGYIDTTYEKLCKLFGKPTHVNSKYFDKRWLVEAENGTVFTIFNYQGEDTYCVGGFGTRNKDKQNLSLLKAKEIIGVE